MSDKYLGTIDVNALLKKHLLHTIKIVGVSYIYIKEENFDNFVEDLVRQVLDNVGRGLYFKAEYEQDSIS